MKVSFFLILTLITIGCSGGGSVSSENPTIPDEPTPAPQEEIAPKTYKSRRLLIPSQNVEITEVAKCQSKDPEQECWRNNLLEVVSPKGRTLYRAKLVDSKISLLLPQSGDEKKSWSEEFAQNLSMVTPLTKEISINFSRVERTLDLEFFYSMYRCRSSKLFQQLLPNASPIVGDFIIETDKVFFNTEKYQNASLALRFNRTNGEFISLFAVQSKDGVSPLYDENTNEPIYPVLAYSVDETGVTPNAARLQLPKQPPIDDYARSCRSYYHLFMKFPEAHETWGTPKYYAQNFLPVYDSKLEERMDFQARTGGNVAIDPNTLTSDSSSRFHRLTTLDELFFSPDRFPQYPYKTDPLWEQIQKLKAKNLKESNQ